MTWSFQKCRTGIWSLLYYLERWVFFSGIYDIFFGQKMKDDLSQEMHGNMVFSVYMYKCYQYDNTLLQKNWRWSSPKKNTLESEWHSRLHSRKNSEDSLYFCWDFHRRFHCFHCILLSSEKNPRNLIYRIEIWLLLQFIWWAIFFNEDSSILCFIQP